MKRNLYLIFLFSFLFPLLLTTSSHALFNSDVKKAREFMKAGMYPQAISLLEKRVNDKPADAEAHYELGVCYINTGNFRGADQRFASAVKLKPDYGYSIGGEHQKAGTESLKKNSVNSTISLFRKAVEFQPELKDSIAQECFDAGKSYLNKKQSKNADRLLSMAVEYNPALKDESDKVTREYGLELLAIAKEKPKKERKPYVVEALKYVAQKDVDAVLPPPSWKVTFGPKEYKGKGMGYYDYIKTITNGVEYEYGNRIIITGSDFEVRWDGKWNKPENNKYVINVNSRKKGMAIGVKNSKGKKFTVKVERLIGSY